ncbi:hypothetical protein J0H58_16780 [bacterium]|nr:hypothetical protein [bacterium]
MDDEKPAYNLPRRVRRAISRHGPDVVENFYSHILLTSSQLGVGLIPVVFAGGAAAGVGGPPRAGGVAEKDHLQHR